MLIGGGDVSWIDAESSVQAGRPVVAVGGTGGVANALTARSGESDDARGAAMKASGLLTPVDMSDGPPAVAAAGLQALSGGRSPTSSRPRSAAR